MTLSYREFLFFKAIVFFTLTYVNTQTTDPNTTAATIITTVAPALVVQDSVFCTCDLTLNVCDINCCCDTTCATDDLAAFTCESTQTVDTTDSVCLASGVLFRTDVNYITNVTTSDQICVSLVGTSSADSYTTPYLLDTQSKYDEYGVSNYSSYSYNGDTSSTATTTTTAATAIADIFSAAAFTTTASSGYKYGDEIIVLDKLDYKGVLYFPSENTYSGSCMDNTPARFLENASTTCTRKLSAPLFASCEAQGFLSISSYIDGLRVLPSPDVYNSSDNSAPLESLVPMNTYSSLLEPVIDPDADACYNVVIQVDYLVVHQAGVIQSVNISYVTRNFSSTRQTYSITQKLRILFQEVSPVRLSGRPGYITGEPVRAGWRTNDVIYLSEDQMKYVTILQSTSSGLCDPMSRQPILYGENVVSGCVLDESFTSSNCSQKMQEAYSQLIDQSLNASVHIARFGDSDVTSLGDWVPLLQDCPLSETLCNGLTMYLDILYAKLGPVANPQYSTVGAKLRFETQMLTSESGKYIPSSRFTVMTIVSFVDVTSYPSRQLVGQTDSIYGQKSQPGLFYPFIWAASNVSQIWINNS